MKKNLLLCFILLVSLSIFISCKDDDDPAPAVNYSETIAGTYKGDLNISFSNTPATEETTQKIYITSVSSEIAKLELKEFKFSGIPIGDITINSVSVTPVEGSSDSYTLSGEQDLTINIGAEMQVHVVLTGQVTGKQAKLDIVIKDVIAVGDVTVKFDGNKMENDNENTEALITSFSVDDEKMICSYIDNETHTVILYVTGISHPFKLTPTITVSDGATISPASGTEQDFQNNDVIYTVKAQDSIHSTTYTVKCERHAALEIEKVSLQEENALFGDPYIKGNEIILFVNNTNGNMNYTPVFTANGANITPASGSTQDFSNGPVKYTLTAIDNEHITKEYFVTIKQNTNKFSFEEWVVENIIDEKEQKKPLGGWSSTNTAVSLLISMQMASDFSTVPSTDAKAGTYAASLTTLDTKGQDMGFVKIPKITAGSLFLGNFNIDHAMSDQLLCTEFGVAFYQKPTRFKGSYKYIPGTTYYYCADPAKSNETTVKDDITDSPAINAILYMVDDYSQTLTGKDILTSDKIVAIAQAADNQAHPDFYDFDIEFEYKTPYDATKKYKLAIVCSSSKDGDKFSGAPGSTLIVDEFEIITE